MKVRTRFAPSPTGFLHLGGARTALFSWLYARKNKGEFILRIEDTDRVRSKKEYLDEILESLRWLGIDWDKIFYQSERFDIYREYAKKLVSQGKAYKKEGAIFFRYEFKEIKINDLIRGQIIFKELPKEEEVIIKSDGTPAYNFSCCIDDALMGITHIIRGEDHISNTPKQILMYEALVFNIPEFAHVPLILSESGQRLSKRFGATSLREYREKGYLSRALVNYLLLLGWSPGNNREIISLEEAVKIFDIRNVNKTSSIFSFDKLDWVNSEYIKAQKLDDLVKLVKDYLEERKFLSQDIEDDYLRKVVELFKTRISKLSDLIEWAYFCFYDDFVYAPDTEEILRRDLSREMEILIERLAKLESFNRENIEKEFRATAADLGLKAKDLVHPTRVALTGKKIGPGLFETMEVLGRDRVIDRLRRMVKYWGGDHV
ncbi:MAG: glutamate--tRNA ligase [Candidatus Duberdicusella sinuisediminis]|nr:MAG: glutamate--tRNA ligase [Candidatus Omnitrophota bacterium]